MEVYVSVILTFETWLQSLSEKTFVNWSLKTGISFNQ